MTELSLTKRCSKCKAEKALTEFYKRSGIANPTTPAHVLAKCIDCAKQISAEDYKTNGRLAHDQPRAYSDQLALDYLTSFGIPALPGKAYRMATLDVLAWGCVRIEVKYSTVHTKPQAFQFGVTAKQQRDGYLADVVMLICDYPDGRKTYHFFRPSDPIFHLANGKRKRGFAFTPGQETQLRHKGTRVCLTQPMMDAARDRVDMIEAQRIRISNNLKASALTLTEIVVDAASKAA